MFLQLLASSLALSASQLSTDNGLDAGFHKAISSIPEWLDSGDSADIADQDDDGDGDMEAVNQPSDGTTIITVDLDGDGELEVIIVFPCTGSCLYSEIDTDADGDDDIIMIPVAAQPPATPSKPTASD